MNPFAASSASLRLPDAILGGYTRPFPGQMRCGDRIWWHTHDDGDLHADGVTLALVDGLGHGPSAYAAAGGIVATLEHHLRRATVEATPEPMDLPSLIRALHQSTDPQAGGSITLAHYRRGLLQLVAIGNTVARIVGPGISRVLLSPDGNLGTVLPTPRPHRLMLEPGQGLLCYSDGVKSHFDFEALTGRHTARPSTVARQIVTQHGKHHDDASALLLRRLRN